VFRYIQIKANIVNEVSLFPLLVRLLSVIPYYAVIERVVYILRYQMAAQSLAEYNIPIPVGAVRVAHVSQVMVSDQIAFLHQGYVEDPLDLPTHELVIEFPVAKISVIVNMSMEVAVCAIINQHWRNYL
jgi:hypothetical protein